MTEKIIAATKEEVENSAANATEDVVNKVKEVEEEFEKGSLTVEKASEQLGVIAAESITQDEEETI